MSNEIDPIEFGRLLASVENLNRKIDTLTQDVDELKEKFSGGKGILIGIALASGGIGVAASKLIEGMFK